jgi:hypothetical protein
MNDDYKLEASERIPYNADIRSVVYAVFESIVVDKVRYRLHIIRWIINGKPRNYAQLEWREVKSGYYGTYFGKKKLPVSDDDIKRVMPVWLQVRGDRLDRQPIL